MEQALQQYEQNAGIPIPIIIRPTDEWQAHRIGQHTALPTDGKPLKQWSDPDDFWADVQQGIRRQVKRIMEQRAERRP
jgi:internalin A